MTVLLTNAEHKQTLAAIRGMKRENINVYAASWQPKALGFYSGLVNSRIIHVRPKSNPSLFKEELITFLKKKPIDVLIPIGLDTGVLISQVKSEYEKYTRVPVASYDSYSKAHDKNIVTQIAERLKIPTVKSSSPASFSEVKKLINEFTYPIVIKARKGSGTSQVRYAFTKKEAIQIFKRFKKIAIQEKSYGIIDHSNPLFQEYLPGDIYDCLVLYANGKIRAAMVQKRMLTYPVNGGSGCLNITIKNQQLVKYSKRLMDHLNWHGVAMIEFKADFNGQPRLLEVNPKFWGTLGLSISAGMNFPYLLYRVALDGDIPFQKSYNVGKVHGWPFPLGVRHILYSKNRWKSIRKFLLLASQFDSTDIKLNDLTPFSTQLYYTFREVLRYLIK